MKRTFIFTALSILVLATFGVGCSDGAHKSAPSWTLTPGLSDDLNDDAGVITLDCVNVVDYEDINASDLPTNSEPTELTTGDVTTGSVTPTSVMYKMSVKSIDAATKAIRDCIEAEIDMMDSSGSSHYWNSMTWILTRQVTTKPAKSSVRIVDLTGCSQIQAADCLLIN